MSFNRITKYSQLEPRAKRALAREHTDLWNVLLTIVLRDWENSQWDNDFYHLMVARINEACKVANGDCSQA